MQLTPISVRYPRWKNQTRLNATLTVYRRAGGIRLLCAPRCHKHRLQYLRSEPIIPFTWQPRIRPLTCIYPWVGEGQQTWRKADPPHSASHVKPPRFHTQHHPRWPPTAGTAACPLGAPNYLCVHLDMRVSQEKNTRTSIEKKRLPAFCGDQLSLDKAIKY